MSLKKDYFGLPEVVSIVLAIIPFTSWLCGFITRLQEKDYIASFIRIFLGFNIIWLIDLLFMISKRHIWRLIND